MINTPIEKEGTIPSRSDPDIEQPVTPSTPISRIPPHLGSDAERPVTPSTPPPRATVCPITMLSPYLNSLANECAKPKVAVITMLGSLCPITLGHVKMFELSRSLLLNEDGNYNSLRPHDLEDFDGAVGLISLNSDDHVRRKLRQTGYNALNLNQRSDLVLLATQDHDWLTLDPSGTFANLHVLPNGLRHIFPKIDFVNFIMNGADDVLKYAKYHYGNLGHNTRSIMVGRAGYTDKLRGKMKYANIDLNKNLLLTPDVPNFSSTRVRAAIRDKNRDELKELIHPDVLEWHLAVGCNY